MTEWPHSPFGTGSPDASLMLVGEAWGEKEEAAGRPFVGVSGDELDRYLASIRIPRGSVYVTNLVQERPPNNSDPTPELIAKHEQRLRAELAIVRPRYVVTLGRFSTRWFLGPQYDRYSNLMERETGLGHLIRVCSSCGAPQGTVKTTRLLQNSEAPGRLLDLDGDDRKGLWTDRGSRKRIKGPSAGIRTRNRANTKISDAGPSVLREALCESEALGTCKRAREHKASQRAQNSLQVGTSTVGRESIFPESEENKSEAYLQSSDLQRMQPPSDACVLCGSLEAFIVCCVPIHHPAYGLYMPEEQTTIQAGFDRLREIMDGKRPPHPPRDEWPSPLYCEITQPFEVEQLLGKARVVAVDTEGSVARPWCLTACVEPGVAYLIAASNRECIAAFKQWLAKYEPLVVCHFLAHDWEVLAAMGIALQISRCADTMLIRYLLGPHYSQALKLSAYRELGMEMRDYPELVAPYDRQLALEYLQRVLTEGRCSECRGWGETVAVRHFKTNQRVARAMKKCAACGGDGTSWPVPQPLPIWENGRLTSWQPSRVGARARRIVADVIAERRNRDGELTDPRRRWEGADPYEAIAPVEEKLGRMPRATLDMVPREQVIAYACADADATLRLWRHDDPLLDERGLRGCYELDLRVVPAIIEMQQAGMRVDTEYFGELVRGYRHEKARLRHQLRALVGYHVNPGSSKQVANLLFERLRLVPVKKTRSKEAESTDDKVIEQLLLTLPAASKGAEACKLIARHRELDKLDGTYASPLSKVSTEDSRVHMEFRYTRTATGRLSSAKPRDKDKRTRHNYIQGQNIPTRTEEGKRIQFGFVAREGYLLGSWDLSQIEWRVMAHLTQDENLLRVFREGRDLHVVTASLIWKLAEEAVTAELRQSAKNVGFGMGYKITAKGIVVQFAMRGIRITEAEGQAFIDGFMRAYPGIPKFWDSIFQQARRDGYVRSPSGRMRWVTAVRSKAPWVREAAEREAGNAPVQGFAADIIKAAMVRLVERSLPAMRRRGYDVRMLLQIHDALVFEFPEGLEELVDSQVRYAMANAADPPLSVPVFAEGKVGKRWSELEPLAAKH